MKNNSKVGKDSKDNEAMSRTGMGHASFGAGNSVKRPSTAKSRQEKKKVVVYDRVSSKKSLKNEEYGRGNTNNNTNTNNNQ